MTTEQCERRLTAIEQCIAVNAEASRQVGELLKRHDEYLHGTPSRAGLLTQVDRLKQQQARRDKWQWLIVGACLSAITALLVKFYAS